MEAPGTGSLSWDWQRELEVFAGRLARGRADEAAALRRAAEEAERAALQRGAEAERRSLAGHGEESAALQNFLSGWHNALDAQVEQILSQLAMLHKRADQEAVDVAARSQLDAISTRLDSWEVKFQEVSDLKEGQKRLKEDFEAQQLAVLAKVSKCQEMQSEAKQAMTLLETRVQEVEARGAVAARGLRALEPFVEQVTARLEPLEPAIEGLKSELSAASQVHRTAIAAEGRRSEEGLAALGAELTKQQELSARLVEDGARMMRGLQEAEEAAEAAAKQAGQLDAQMQQAAQRLQEEMAELRRASAQKLQDLEAVLARRGELQRGAELRRDEEVKKLRDEFQDAVSRAVGQAKENLGEKMQRHEEVQRGLRSEVEELQRSWSSSTDMLRSLQQQSQKLQEAFEKTKGQGISFDWKIPRCLQRLRYLSLLVEPGLWLDSEPFHLSSLGPLEMRLYAKGLRGGNGQCAIALRLVEANAQGAVPLMMDLQVGSCSRRATQCPDPEGLESMVWLAESMGVLEDHLEANELAELTIRSELPLLAAPALLASRPPSTMGSLDDLRDLPKAFDVSRSRDLRGVPSRDLPTLPISDPSGPFARSWNAKGKGLDELMAPIPRNPVAVPDDAAR